MIPHLFFKWKCLNFFRLSPSCFRLFYIVFKAQTCFKIKIFETVGCQLYTRHTLFFLIFLQSIHDKRLISWNNIQHIYENLKQLQKTKFLKDELRLTLHTSCFIYLFFLHEIHISTFFSTAEQIQNSPEQLSKYKF